MVESECFYCKSSEAKTRYFAEDLCDKHKIERLESELAQMKIRYGQDQSQISLLKELVADALNYRK